MKIHVEFCVKWNYEPEFERVSNTIQSLRPDAKIRSNENGHRTGAFEVAINDRIVFSKFETSRFPSDKEIREWL